MAHRTEHLRRVLQIAVGAGKRIGWYVAMLAGVGLVVGSVSLAARMLGFHGDSARLLRMLMLGFYAVVGTAMVAKRGK